MTTSPFEIRVAVVGGKGSGKTTLLNAIFQNRYSHVSLDHGTQSVNHFVLYQQDANTPMIPDLLTFSAEETYQQTQEVNTKKEKIKSEDSTVLQEHEFNILINYEALQGRNDVALVFLDVPGLMVEEEEEEEDEEEEGERDMTTKDPHKKYLEETWDSIDCLIFVADLKNESTVQRDKKLLKFVNAKLLHHQDKNISNNCIRRHVPLLILGNKVDDPDDKWKILLAQQARQELLAVLETFDTAADEAAAEETNEDAKSPSSMSRNSVSLSRKSSEDIDTAASFFEDSCYDRDEVVSTENGRGSTPPKFIPISAKTVFPYAYASTLSKEQLALERDIMDQIGRDEIGKTRWKRLSQENQEQLVYKVVSDPAFLEDRVESTNFHRVLRWLHETVGSKKAQTNIIQNQQQWHSKTLTATSNIVQKLRQMHLHNTLATNSSGHQGEGGSSSGSQSPLVGIFWNLYRESELAAFVDFEADMNVQALERPINQLLQYLELLAETGWEELLVVEKAMHTLVKKQLHVVMSKKRSYSFRHWYLRRNQESWQKQPDLTSWDTLSPPDWANIYSSILLVGANRHFCERLGHEKIIMETLLQKSHLALYKEPIPSTMINNMEDGTTKKRRSIFSAAGSVMSSLTGTRTKRTGETGGSEEDFQCADKCPSLRHALDGRYDLSTGKFRPDYPETYDCVVQLHPPDDLSDPHHWGHAAWVYTNFIMAMRGE